MALAASDTAPVRGVIVDESASSRRLLRHGLATDSRLSVAAQAIGAAQRKLDTAEIGRFRAGNVQRDATRRSKVALT